MPDAPQPPPKTLGDYALLSRLSVGGMAELFLAKDEKRDRLVVIKRIHPYLCEDDRLVGMFLDEAKIAAQLDHPSVIQILELGQRDGSPFIAMEYVEGVDLWQLCEEQGREGRTVPVAIAVYVAAQICAGLDHAHDRKSRDGLPLNIIHRDVNPKNVMIGFDGAVKLVDFGIAKARTMIEQTKPGMIKGKYHYFSPEQVTQQPVDRRTDIFAIGITLYEVMSGKNPFTRPTLDGMLAAICKEPVAPLDLGRDTPRELVAIVGKCLMKDPRQRYQSAREVQADLENFLRESNQTMTARGLSQYLATLFKRGDDPTLPWISISARKAALGESMPIPPLRGEDSDRVSPKLLQAAKAFQQGLADSSEREELGARPLPPTVAIGGAATTNQRALRADDDPTMPIASPHPEPTTQPSSRPKRRARGAGLAVAVIAAALLGAGLYLQGASDPLLANEVIPPSPVEPVPVEPVPVEPVPVEPVPVEPVPVEPAPVEPALVAPVPVEPAPVAPAAAFSVVDVRFSGPAGVKITRDGRHHLQTGAVKQLPPGTYRLVYRCPARGRSKARYKALSLTVPNTSATMDVAVSCR